MHQDQYWVFELGSERERNPRNVSSENRGNWAEEKNGGEEKERDKEEKENGDDYGFFLFFFFSFVLLGLVIKLNKNQKRFNLL